eukprot:XP_011664824.1 PREDICTED: centromere protein M [Strongylocentrotus purpuratus]
METILGAKQPVLHPFNKLPELNSAVVLLIGFQSIKKKELAEAMVALNTEFCLQVRTATQLPLPSINDEQRPKIDLIVFILDVNVNMSLKTVADSLPHLDPTYFLGRVCFLALNAPSEKTQCADLGDILALCDAYDSPLICGDLETVADSLPHLDPTYFLGRVCFLALNAPSEKTQCADLGDILALCDAYDSPLICGDLETQEQRESLARRLVEMTEIAAGFKNDP